MQFLSNRRVLFALTIAVSALGAGFAACGGGSTSTAPASSGSGSSGGAPGGTSDAGNAVAPAPEASTGGGDDGGLTNVDGNTVGTAPGSCPNPTVTIDFSPMYSAFIPGSTMHTFAIPAVTDDGNTAMWSISDPTQAQLVAETFNGLPGVLITVQGVGTNGSSTPGAMGQLTVVATEANGACGTSTLTITTASEDLWQIGNQRYNNGVALQLGPPPGFDGGFGMGGPPPDGGFGDGGFGMGGRPDGGGGMGGGRFMTTDGGSFYERDGGTACTNCHGPTAVGPNSPYQDVSHSPEQTGGFSDSDLVAIFTQGILPDGGYFDPSVVNANCDGGAACTLAAYQRWQAFHRWDDITPDQYPGIIAYLRSITPVPQNGKANFGGGGGRRRDGGPGGPGMMGPPPLDAGTE